MPIRSSRPAWGEQDCSQQHHGGGRGAQPRLQLAASLLHRPAPPRSLTAWIRLVAGLDQGAEQNHLEAEQEQRGSDLRQQGERGDRLVDHPGAEAGDGDEEEDGGDDGDGPREHPGHHGVAARPQVVRAEEHRRKRAHVVGHVLDAAEDPVAGGFAAAEGSPDLRSEDAEKLR